ncbi:ABC transporter permease [Nocardia sp. NEAU-G5]|uniref:ABC transporter permease n=1 Tax=Nocardia albiluteola TaxID=2842303 RepID=A0ABS6B821_9NOCA|nr:ABC transporter permease [Nocardia albiluteola]MBU3066278.1 ABC transporter permease [Nocardia albiluteola]
MIPTAVRCGTRRGLIELRQAFAGTAMIGQLLWPVATLVSIFVFRNRPLPGNGTLGAFILPSVLGTYVAMGMLLVIQYLAVERDDGTLLRAKLIPGGIQGYLIGKMVTVSATVGVYLVIVAGPGLPLVHGLAVGSVGAWLTLAWVVPLGLLATQPIGAMLGSLVSGPRAVGYVSAVVMGMIAISGIFYPVTAMPRWLQWVAQVFPVYWLGLGMRSALLPHDALAAELGHSWRHVETAAVLGVWAVAGMVSAPAVLRRMARRESGSALAVRRERALRQAGR